MAKQAIEHKDILDRVIEVGDVIAMASHNSLAVAIVDKLNPKMVRVKRPNSTWAQNKYPQDLIKLTAPKQWYIY
jgi:aspartate 1-decarboxylase